MRERGRAIAAVAGLLVLVLVSVIFLTSRPRDRVSWFEAALRDGLSPLLLAVSRVTQTVTGAWESAVNVKDAHQENARLRAEIEALRREVSRLEEFERQNAAFRMALNLPPNTPHPVVFAEVIARPLNNWWGVLTINKGRRHGVEPQSGVVATGGVVGHVRTSGTFSSEVILLIDPRSAVGGIVQRTGAPVLVEGMGFPGTELRLRPLSAGVDIQEGDVIVTSGLSRLFPKGIPIGAVKQVDVGPFGLSVDVIVQPFVDFGTLEVVTVLIGATTDDGGDEPVDNAAYEGAGIGVDERARIGADEHASIGVDKRAGIGVDHYAGVGVGEHAGIGADERARIGADEHAGIGADEHASIGADEHASIGADEHASIGADEHASIGVDKRAGIGVDDYAGVGVGEHAGIGAGQRADAEELQAS